MHNKTTIYKAIRSPIWRYGIKVYGVAAKTNLNIIRVDQSKILRRMCNAPWYMRNRDIERDVGVPMIGDVLQQQAENYRQKLCSYPNVLSEVYRQKMPKKITFT